MDSDSSSSYPYTIHHEKLNLHLKIVDVNSLFIHEETIPEMLVKLAQEIRMDKTLRHPVIVDEKSLVVLDGMHRVAALKMLNCKRIPVCLVDYRNPSISVGAWYRTIASSGGHSINDALKEIEFRVEDGDVKSVEEIGKNGIFAVLKTPQKSYLFYHEFKDLKEAYDHIKVVENKLKQYGFQVSYETEFDSLRKLQEGKVNAVLQTPKLSKEEIVKTALSGKVFAHKATRHIIPARPLNLNVPLTLLTDPNLSLKEANEEFKRILTRKRLKMVPAGSYIENRRYEEDVYLFED